MAHSRLMDKLDQAVINHITGKVYLRDISRVIVKDGVITGKTYWNGRNEIVKVRNIQGYAWEVIS